MRRIDFKVPIYDWDVTVITLYGPSDVEDYRNILREVEALDTQAEQSVQELATGWMNGGDLWRDIGKRRALLSIFPWSSDEKFVDVYNHEKRHLVDRILEHAGVHDIESSALLDGYISVEIYKHLDELMT